MGTEPLNHRLYFEDGELHFSVDDDAPNDLVVGVYDMRNGETTLLEQESNNQTTAVYTVPLRFNIRYCHFITYDSGDDFVQSMYPAVFANTETDATLESTNIFTDTDLKEKLGVNREIGELEFTSVGDSEGWMIQCQGDVCSEVVLSYGGRHLERDIRSGLFNVPDSYFRDLMEGINLKVQRRGLEACYYSDGHSHPSYQQIDCL